MNQRLATRPAAAPTEPAFSATEIEAARRDMARAFELAGLVHQGRPVCPHCGTSTRGKVKIRDNGSWYCYPCGTGSGNNRAIDFLAERLGYRDDLAGADFVEVVSLLTGRPVSRSRSSRSGSGRPDRALPVPEMLSATPSFTATVDVEVYRAVLAHGDVDQAVAYYGRFHIADSAVVESKAVVIADIARLHHDLMSTFGTERLVACGLLRPGDDERKAFWMVNDDYPVVEPHLRPNGDPVGMQFRPSYQREARYRRHQAYKAARDHAEQQGVPFRDPERDETYVPKFLSLRGGVPGEHLVGCGLPRISSVDPDSDICVVEGFKDMLAMRTMGFEAYAIPGAKAMPSERVCRILARHTAVLCLDADDAGDAGVEALEQHFDSMGVRHRRSRRRFPSGWDVTDLLVSRHLKRGCHCTACTDLEQRIESRRELEPEPT